MSQYITDDEFSKIIRSSLTWTEALTRCGLKNKTIKFEKRIKNLSIEDKKHLPLNFAGIYSKIEKHSRDFYKELIRKSTNWDEIIKTLQITNQLTFNNVKKHLDVLNIDVSHLIDEKKIFENKQKKLEDILVENSTRNNSMSGLKKRFIKELKWKWECSGCKKSTHWTHWTGEVKIPLQVDHINGDRTNNTIENLRLLCSTCHSLTSTYCGKNIKKEVKKVVKEVKEKLQKVQKVKEVKEKLQKKRPEKEARKTKKCLDCETSIYEGSMRCVECNNKYKINKVANIRPSKEQIVKDLLEFNNNISSLAKKYNISNKTLKRWLK